MAKPARRLQLSRERLTELSSDELGTVVGGVALTTPCLTGTETYTCPTLPVRQCFILVTVDNACLHTPQCLA